MRCAWEVGSENAGNAMSAAHNAPVAARAVRRFGVEMCSLAMLMAITHSLAVAETRRHYTGAKLGLGMSQVPDVASCRQPDGEGHPDRLCAVNCEPGHSTRRLDRLPKLSWGLTALIVDPLRPGTKRS